VSMVASVVSQTDVVATIPASLGAALGQPENPSRGLVVSPVPVETDTFPIAMAWHSSFDNDAAQTWLRTIVLETLEPLRQRAIDLEAAAGILRPDKVLR